MLLEIFNINNNFNVHVNYAEINEDYFGSDSLLSALISILSKNIQ